MLYYFGCWFLPSPNQPLPKYWKLSRYLRYKDDDGDHFKAITLDKRLIARDYFLKYWVLFRAKFAFCEFANIGMAYFDE